MSAARDNVTESQKAEELAGLLCERRLLNVVSAVCDGNVLKLGNCEICNIFHL